MMFPCNPSLQNFTFFVEEMTGLIRLSRDPERYTELLYSDYKSPTRVCDVGVFKQFTGLYVFSYCYCLHWPSRSFLLWIKYEEYYFKGDKSESCFTVHHTTRDPVCVSGREQLGSGNLSHSRWQTGGWWYWTTDYLSCRAIWDAN